MSKEDYSVKEAIDLITQHGDMAPRVAIVRCLQNFGERICELETEVQQLTIKMETLEKEKKGKNVNKEEKKEKENHQQSATAIP